MNTPTGGDGIAVEVNACEACDGYGYFVVPFTGGTEAECTMCDGTGELMPADA